MLCYETFHGREEHGWRVAREVKVRVVESRFLFVVRRRVMKTPRPWVLLSVLFLLVLASCSQPDEAQSTILETQFGTRGSDSVEDVAYSKNGYIYAVGIWDSALDERFRYSSTYNGRGSDAFLRRYDRSGNLLWESYFDIEPEFYNYDRYLEARLVTADKSGNAIVAWSATYRAEFENPDGTTYWVSHSFRYLSKYSPNGSKIWRVSTADKQLKDLALDSSGSIYGITGYDDFSAATLIKFSSSGTKVWETPASSGNAAPTSVAISSTNNVYIIRHSGVVEKYNSSGSKLWSKGIGVYQQNYKIAAGLNDELFALGGYAYKYEPGDGCDAGESTVYYYARVYKLSNIGLKQWQRNVASMVVHDGGCGGDDYDGWEPKDGLALTTDTLGNVYVAGGSSANSYYSAEAFVAKYNRSGSPIWSRMFSSGAPIDGATSIATYDGGEVYVGAVTYGSLVHRNLGGSDAVLRKMDKNGNRVWTR